MRRLILLPFVPGTAGGYDQAVASDLRRIAPTSADHVIFYAPGNPESPPPYAWSLLSRTHNRRLRSIYNVSLGRQPTEVTERELSHALPHRDFDELFCGDTNLYRAARALFPQLPCTVRFHNFYSFAAYRQMLRRFPLPVAMRYNLYAFVRLESAILKDPLVTPVFITAEELQYAQLAFALPAATWWPVVVPSTPKQLFRLDSIAPRLLFFGSMATHTLSNIRYFAGNVLPKMRARVPRLETHFYGHAGVLFADAEQKLFGHPRFADGELPMNGDGLFINPELLGCGIKLKLSYVLQRGAALLTTPCGVEGYSAEVHDRPNVIVADIDLWPEEIARIFGATS